MLAESGVRRIRLADTVGILTPERSARFFRRYRRLLNRMQRQNIALEAHMHNDFGLACSNTIAAWRAGAEFINTTLLGAGERAGNAPFEDTVLCLERLYETRTGIRLGDLQPLIEFLVTSAKIDLPLWKSGVGRYAFSHASGLHVDGVFKDPATYEPYPPETIGRSRELIIGRLTGRCSERLRCEQEHLPVGFRSGYDPARSQSPRNRYGCRTPAHRRRMPEPAGITITPIAPCASGIP